MEHGGAPEFFAHLLFAANLVREAEEIENGPFSHVPASPSNGPPSAGPCR
jgi:hypothetical protein